MFWLLWLRSLTVKRPQAALAIASVLVGATVASMLLNLYGDVRRKMTQEFRAYGPNLVVSPAASPDPGRRDQPALPEASSRTAGSLSNPETVEGVMDERVVETLAPFAQRGHGFAAVPVLYAVTEVKKVAKASDPAEAGRLEDPENVVAVGADFGALHRVYPSWRVSADAAAPGHGLCVVGAHLASRLRLGRGDSVELFAIGGAQEEPSAQSYRIAAILTTGASEDDQVFVPLATLQRMAGLEGKVSMVELSVPGDTAEVEGTMAELNRALRSFAGVEVRAIRQIVYSSGKVLETVRWVMLSLTGLILIIIALCVMATMTAIVLERRKDIAVMKSLGASDRLVMQLLLTEGATLGMIGGIAGFALGLGLAHEMARRLFGVSLSPAGAGWWTFPTVCLASMMLAVVATLVPVEMVRGIQPARELRGE